LRTTLVASGSYRVQRIGFAHSLEQRQAIIAQDVQLLESMLYSNLQERASVQTTTPQFYEFASALHCTAAGPGRRRTTLPSPGYASTVILFGPRIGDLLASTCVQYYSVLPPFQIVVLIDFLNYV
jgi:hypothetical protein